MILTGPKISFSLSKSHLPINVFSPIHYDFLKSTVQARKIRFIPSPMEWLWPLVFLCSKGFWVLVWVQQPRVTWFTLYCFNWGVEARLSCISVPLVTFTVYIINLIGYESYSSLSSLLCKIISPIPQIFWVIQGTRVCFFPSSINSSTWMLSML